MLTTPTPLAETIATLQGFIDAGTLNPGQLRHIAIALACARRCEAIDGASKERPKSLHSMNLGALTGPLRPFAMYVAEDVDPYIDQLLAERDALAKRVRELDGQAAKMILRLRDTIGRARDAEADSARLREENERLRSCGAREIELKAEVARIKHRLSERTSIEAEKSLELIAAQERAESMSVALADVTALLDRRSAELCATQDRVRELEASSRPPTHDEQDQTGDVDTVCDGCGLCIDPDEHDWAACCLGLRQHRDRLLDAKIAAEFGPITDPTQGTVKTKRPDLRLDVVRRDAQGNELEREPAERGKLLTEEFVARVKETARPSCVPPGTPREHWTTLPSGLHAWVEEADHEKLLFIEQTNARHGEGHWSPSGAVYTERFSGFRRAVTEEDFLAARALGVRVLGWKS